MAYTITNTYALDPSYAGASLRCQLVQYSAGAQVNSGTPISTGFFEQAGGQGLFDHALSVADDFVGWAHIYDNAAPSVILASVPINPRELEYTDARSSGILSAVNGLITTVGAAGAGLTALPGMVWSAVTRTLTGGGGGATAAEIWSYATRALTSLGMAGGIEYTYTLTSSGGGVIADALLWFATDAAISNTVWFGTTDAFGVARDASGNKPRLAPGTYYIRAQKSGYMFDIDTETVS